MSYGVRERLRERERSAIAGAVIVGAALLVAPLVLGSFQTSLLIEVLLFAVFATAFNLVYGYTGLLSFGHAMFVAVAAYTAAKVYRFVGPALGFPEIFGGASVLATFLTTILLGLLAATLIAVFIGYLSVQLEEIYFAMITLSFSMAIWVVFNQDITGQIGERLGYPDLLVTNGSDGLTIAFESVGAVDLFGFQFVLVDINSYLTFYYIALVFFLLSMYALWRIVRSPFGAVCQAVRENPQRAEALGIDVTYHSWMTFIVSGAFSGLVGALLATFNTNALPGLAYWTFSALPVIMTVVGGPYTFLGPTAGAFLYEYLRYIISQFQTLEAHWQFFFGAIILLVVLFFPNGLSGGLLRARSWILERTGRGPGPAEPEPEEAD